MTAPRWQTLLMNSAEAHMRGKAAKYEAGRFLWLGAKAALKDWSNEDDPIGVILYRNVLTALGGTRKSAASKIKTVALATVAYDLDPNAYGSLNAAYNAANRMGLGLDADPEPVCSCTCHHNQ